MSGEKPLAVDLCCGLGGWAEGLLAAGWEVIGVDVDPRFIGRYPAQLVIQDVLTVSGVPMRGRVGLIVASPPCQEPSYRAMPWKRAKALNAAGPPHKFVELFRACFRIAEEAECPLVVENVKGAQPWVGRARWHYGSFYLWGSVPALMPPVRRASKNNGGSWFAVAHNTTSGTGQNPDGRKVNTHVAENSPKGTGKTSWFWKNTKHELRGEGVKQNGSGAASFDRGIAHLPSCSERRREASAQIAKIPFELAYHIGSVFYPGGERYA